MLIFTAMATATLAAVSITSTFIDETEVVEVEESDGGTGANKSVGTCK